MEIDPEQYLVDQLDEMEARIANLQVLIHVAFKEKRNIEMNLQAVRELKRRIEEEENRRMSEQMKNL